MTADASTSAKGDEPRRDLSMPADERAAPRAIDVHAHCVPAQLLRAVREDGGRHRIEVLESSGRVALSLGGRMTRELPTALIDTRDRAGEMQRTGVAQQLLSPWMELTPLGPPADAGLTADDTLWFSHAYNDALAEVVASSNGRFSALAMVPLQDPPAAAKELVRALTIGLSGVEIASSIDGVDLCDTTFEPFWREAEERGAFVLVHPLRPLGAQHYNTHRLPDIVGNPAESTAAVGRWILSGLLRRFPRLRLCVVHGGGFLPYQAGRFEAIAGLEPHSWPAGWIGEDLHKLYFDSLTHSDQSLHWLIEFAGADHVLIGGDYPFPTGCADPVTPVLRLGDLSATQRMSVLRENARTLLDSVRH